ncbi:zinc finger protein 665-like [Physella acuta]|uniref:zinc finger protein 665-like n=1 Tax=Physella acuta TaxID=109671 RepID=UPI0027DDB569|nr:zinc finger protein 665-like [Physella acuta]
MNEEKNLSAPLGEMLVHSEHGKPDILNCCTTSDDTNDIEPDIFNDNTNSGDTSDIKPVVLNYYTTSDDTNDIKPDIFNNYTFFDNTNDIKPDVLNNYTKFDFANDTKPDFLNNHSTSVDLNTKPHVLNNSRTTNVVKSKVSLSYQTNDIAQAKPEIVNDMIGLQKISSSVNDCSVQLFNNTQNQFMDHENERQIPQSCLCQNALNNQQNLNQNQHREIDSIDLSHHFFYVPTKFDLVDKKYECDAIKLANTSYLRQHKTVHLRRRYQCNLCGIDFTSNSLLKDHMRSHLEKKLPPENKYRCDLCNKTFISQFRVEKHIEIHSTTSTGGQQFICDVCHKEFSVKKYLDLHKKTHSEKKFQCDFCDKRFALLRYLKSHANSHLTEKPHKCKFCNKSYTTRHMLTAHYHLRHHFYKTFSCTVCQQEFYQKKFLIKHKRKQHPTFHQHLFIVTKKGSNVEVDKVLNGESHTSSKSNLQHQVKQISSVDKQLGPDLSPIQTAIKEYLAKKMETEEKTNGINMKVDEVLNGKNPIKTIAHSQQKEDIKPGPSSTKTSQNSKAETSRLIYDDQVKKDLSLQSTTTNNKLINLPQAGNNTLDPGSLAKHNEHAASAKEETRPFVLNEHKNLPPKFITHSEQFHGIKTETFNDLTEIKTLQTRLLENTSLLRHYLSQGLSVEHKQTEVIPPRFHPLAKSNLKHMKKTSSADKPQESNLSCIKTAIRKYLVMRKKMNVEENT